MKWIGKRRYTGIMVSIAIATVITILCNSCAISKQVEYRAKSPIIVMRKHAVRLMANGRVAGVGELIGDHGQANVSGWRNIVSIAASDWHTVGLKSNGRVVATGSNDEGECNVSEWRDIKDIAAGSGFTVGLKTDGTVVVVGDYSRFGEAWLTEWTNIVAVFASDFFIAGLQQDGTVVTACKFEDRLLNVTDWTGIVDIALSEWHIVGLKSDGTVIAQAASNSVSEGEMARSVAEWTDIVAVSAQINKTAALRSDGTVIIKYMGQRTYIFRWKNVKHISTGSGMIMAIDKDDNLIVPNNHRLSSLEGLDALR